MPIQGTPRIRKRLKKPKNWTKIQQKDKPTTNTEVDEKVAVKEQEKQDIMKKQEEPTNSEEQKEQDILEKTNKDKTGGGTVKARSEVETIEERPGEGTAKDRTGKGTAEDKTGKETMEYKSEGGTSEDKPGGETPKDSQRAGREISTDREEKYRTTSNIALESLVMLLSLILHHHRHCHKGYTYRDTEQSHRVERMKGMENMDKKYLHIMLQNLEDKLRHTYTRSAPSVKGEVTAKVSTYSEGGDDNQEDGEDSTGGFPEDGKDATGGFPEDGKDSTFGQSKDLHNQAEWLVLQKALQASTPPETT